LRLLLLPQLPLRLEGQVVLTPPLSKSDHSLLPPLQKADAVRFSPSAMHILPTLLGCLWVVGNLPLPLKLFV
jgi:hypothetical protein